jgi:PAS domain S-box-containing protein
MPVGTYLSVTVLLLCLLLVNTRTENERLAEDARSELESYFRAMFDVIPDGIILTNAERKITMANPAAESMFGYPAGSLCGVGVDSLMPGTLQPEVARERELLLESRTGKSMGNIWQTEGTRLNGSTFPVEFARSSLTTPHGSFILGVARDVTERSLTEEARARMAAIVESSDDAIIGKDLNGIVSSWNPGAEKIFGYSAAEMIGQPILKVVPSDRVQEEADILEHLGRGESIEHAETKRLTKDGRLIDVAISVSPIRNATGKVIGGSKIARDITTSKHLEQQLHQSQKMEAIGQLTGGVAHDFNNLLGVVIGNLDLIERAVAGNEPIVNRVQNAQRAALRGADLTRRMLSFSSRQPLHATATSVAESAENTIEMTKRALGPEIEVSANLDPSIPLVLVDPSGLENALLNLTINARDAMPKGGSIVISARISDVQASYPSSEAQVLPSGRYVAVSVTDTGEGMSQETLERAFEPFFTTKPRGKGTGLGLAMVYGFAKQSGGTARIYSEVGHGTTVTLYLPLAAEVTAESQLIAAPKVQSGRGQLVMVVDDEVDLLDVAVAYLEDMGYRVVHAPDGATALAVLDSEPDVALLVTDVIMPGMDGVELARRVRQASPGVKIVYSSGFPADALSQRNGTRIDGPLLNKPYQRSEFAAVIRLAMSGAGAPTSLVSSGA